MNPTPDAGQCAKILKSLADESRLKIVQLLFTGEKSVTEVVGALQMAQPQVSHHLSILRSSGLVETRREGKKIINFIGPEVKFILESKEIGLDLGCCSIKFDESRNPSSP
ncbi:MAG: metalloregulator ArsR/SmtB family transcription factor [Nitrospinaceae bacterium]|nr:winged helix-turn-helix transcriptional regulator [Nitrospinaceae bacterium]NIR54265.1 winged helix-turn-helix transcriptional regulator [Nitrospinaceae bacterium]NIS84682.1 winged helix-turn-helix transcriptional regulator [Nitrospinaceae bacterium]NIT81477.1 winged helix-turn-helix transcriptional regulator [Nitrospinaceae bacterium]NIU43761.1 winged helix-turn-helix transcriptional regulator [Nitrospinaceae bacterium]